MWFVFRSYGVRGLQAHIRKVVNEKCNCKLVNCIVHIVSLAQQVALARQFEALLKTDIRFELLYPSGLGLVCFRVRASNEANELLVKRINDRKRIHLTPTKIEGSVVIRFAICARATEPRDIHFAFEEITEVTTEVLHSII